MLDLAARPEADDSAAATADAPARLTGGAMNAVNNWVPHDIIMRDAWFPLAHSYSVGRKPVRRAIYSQPFFLWRVNGGRIPGQPGGVKAGQC